MRLNEIYVNESGVLEDVALNNIPGLSVVHGGNGSGKTTLVRFLKAILLDADTPVASVPGATRIGSVQVSDSLHRWTLTRNRDMNGHESTTTQQTDRPDWSGTRTTRFPDWVSDQAFQEILSPGYDDADQFNLLTRLCLETGGIVGSDSEIRRAQEAIAQAIREREGTALEPGVIQQITELERQRDALNYQLANLQRHDPALPAEIRSIKERISALHSHNRRIDEECDRIRLQITDLERRRADLREQNHLALDQHQLRTRIEELTIRRNRWTDLRTSIELESRDSQRANGSSLNRSGHSVRAVVSRLEERMQQRGHDLTEHWHQQVEQETAALCRFVTQQQDAAQAFEQHLESQLSSEAANSIHRMETMLQEKLAALQEELDRADNILDASHHHDAPHCGSTWHRDYRYEDGSSNLSIESLEQELQRLRDQLSARLSEHAANTEEVTRLGHRLEDLCRQVKEVPTLEEIDDLRARLAEVEARLELLISHREVLLRTEHSLEQVVVRLRQSRLPATLEIASPWLRRLTDSECVRIFADTTRTELLIETTISAQPLQICQLSRGTQHQLALVLRLALLEAHSTTSERMPLIIDDVFITSDDDRGSAAADLLKEAASGGQQIILLTCQNDVRALLAARGAKVYSLSVDLKSAPLPMPVPVPEPVVLVESDDSLVFKAFEGAAEEFPGELEDTVVDDDDSHWLFYLEPEHSVSDLAGLEISELNGLTAAGIESIEQLLTCSVSDVKGIIQNAGFFITEDRLSDLLTQATMAVCIPMLRQRDAELLIAAGIDSIRQLALLRPEAVFDLIVRFQRSDSGSRFLRNGITIDQQQAISWNRWALHARTVDRARAAAASRRSQTGRSVGIMSSSQRTRSGFSNRSERTRRNGQSQRRRVNPRISDDNRRRREVRGERRRHQRTQTESSGIPSSSSLETELKFHLHRSSDVEAAPSIGAKIAARLARVGIQTVDDLLNCDAHTIATLLDNRRISAAIIEQWKSQSALVCTIPRLRGHDAQILVACGKNDATEIVDLSPEQLFSVVQPFCDTSDGARIVRSGRKPDLKEVADWISWAQQSRPLKAA
jgi:energy-coupling factor transporter ATP-binding protein EcfA2